MKPTRIAINSFKYDVAFQDGAKVSSSNNDGSPAFNGIIFTLISNDTRNPTYAMWPDGKLFVGPVGHDQVAERPKNPKLFYQHVEKALNILREDIGDPVMNFAPPILRKIPNSTKPDFGGIGK